MNQKSSTFLMTTALALFVCADICGPIAQAAELPNVLTGYSLTSWSRKDGLPSAVVWAIAQDTDGYLWLGTDAGLVRFDGLRFTSWDAIGRTPLKPGPVRSLWTARDGRIWIGYGNEGGVTRIHNGEVRHYGPSEGIPDGPIGMLFEDRDGTLWAGHRTGLYRFTNEKWEKAGTGLPDASVFSAYADRQGTLYVGTAAGIFERGAQAAAFQRVESFDSVVRSIGEDAFNRIWVADPIVGFRRLHERKTPSRAVDEGRGNRLLHDTRGNMWVGTRGHGLWRVRLEPGAGTPTIEKTTALTGLSNDGIECLLEDREGNIWAGTTDGLNRLTPHKVEQVLHLGLVAGVEAMPDGRVWVGTVDALVEFPEGRQHLRREPQTLSAPPLLTLHGDERGVLWVATSRQVLRVEQNRSSPVSFSGRPQPRQVESITSDFRGGIWLYDDDQGLLRWNNGRTERLELPSDLRGTAIVTMYTDSDGRVWLPLADGRLVVMAQNGRTQSYGSSDGVQGVYRAIHQGRDGVVWLGGTDVLSRFSNGRFETLGRGAGLPAGSTTAILEDDSRTLWVAVEGMGVIRIDRAELDRAFANPSGPLRYSQYERADGFAGTPQWFGNSSAARANDGRLWFVSGRGITIIDPKALEETAVASGPVRIEGVVADGERLDMTRDALPPRTSRLEIDYTILNLTSPLRTRFRYRLEGFDDDWIDADTRRQASYTSLPPGKYTFRVIAGNAEGVWGDQAGVWSFSIGPAFFQTRWFFALCAAVVVLAVGGAWRFHVRQVRERFALLLGERARLSREIHDTLLQSMVGVALQFDAIANDIESSPPARTKDQLVRIRKNIEEYIREARQSIWNLRSPRLQSCDLAEALRQAAARATADSAVGFTLTVNGSSTRSSARAEEQLLRIGQEAVINAVRHAHANQVDMELNYDNEAITLKVRDDGRGFDHAQFTSNPDGHYGLISMKERAENAGGTLKVDSAGGRGTEIAAVVPLSPDS